MDHYQSLEGLPGGLRHAVVDLLYRLADDELIIGHRDSEWTGLAPILEEDIAFSAQIRRISLRVAGLPVEQARLGILRPPTVSI